MPDFSDDDFEPEDSEIEDEGDIDLDEVDQREASSMEYLRNYQYDGDASIDVDDMW